MISLFFLSVKFISITEAMNFVTFSYKLIPKFKCLFYASAVDTEFSGLALSAEHYGR